MTAPTVLPNTALAYQVLDYVIAHPELHNQSVWLERPPNDWPTSDCGTIACYAGHTCLLAGDIAEFTGDDPESDLVAVGPARWMSVQARAAQLLRIPGGTASRLYFAVDVFELQTVVADIFGPRPATDCSCDWLGEGTPAHAASPLCRSLRPDGPREVSP